jgi:hypothetical protein
MSRKKTQVARYQISVNQPQKEMIDQLMVQDGQTEISAFFTLLLVKEFKARNLHICDFLDSKCRICGYSTI